MSAGWSNIKYRQDMPPPGGYGTIPYKRNLISRGPSGFVIWGIAGSILLAGIRNHKSQSKLYQMGIEEDMVGEKCLIPLLEAEKDRHVMRRSKELIESEALHFVGSGLRPDHIPGNINEEYHAKRWQLPSLNPHSLLPKSIYRWYQNSQIPKVGP